MGVSKSVDSSKDTRADPPLPVGDSIHEHVAYLDSRRFSLIQMNSKSACM